MVVPGQRLVHLDLKGAPPSVEHIKAVLQLSHSLGATGVLLEWEDMFPWSGRSDHYHTHNVMVQSDVMEVFYDFLVFIWNVVIFIFIPWIFIPI